MMLMFLADHLHLSQPFMMMPPSAPPLLSLDSLLAYTNHVNIILDIESGVAPNEDDQPATVVAAAPTKPRLTGQAVEEAFPTFAYGENENCYECAICLEELKDGDKCRMFLPSCNHTFHKACVDLWLSEDNTCPLCRVVLLS
ncbi:E3 ubiquitin-protein ligase Os03g0188200 [Manihot esculenta]|uniref:E3 ubiquitin-protein ligase Os03g0188200 n=1 Tax=Manihot esculenta TaxID=3983 RepID=UPI000B5D51E2|nr:E3 ubiquitin-protein ligase Os03g0188200 [Manihot esculenta]